MQRTIVISSTVQPRSDALVGGSAAHQRRPAARSAAAAVRHQKSRGRIRTRRIDRAGMDRNGAAIGMRPIRRKRRSTSRWRRGARRPSLPAHPRVRKHAIADHEGIQELQADDQHDGRRQECGGDEDAAIPRDCSRVAAPKRDRGAEDDERDEARAQVTFGTVIGRGRRERIADGHCEDAGVNGEQQHEPRWYARGNGAGRTWPGCRSEGGIHHGAAIMPPGPFLPGRPGRPLQCSTNSVSVVRMSSPIRPATSARTGLRPRSRSSARPAALLRPART